MIMEYDIRDDIDHVNFDKSYRLSKTYKRKEQLLQKILIDNGGISERSIRSILRQSHSLFVNAATKSVIHGSWFNNRVGAKLIKHFGNCVELEAKLPKCLSGLLHERPDWILTSSEGYIIGYNQISLFDGGHQLNRAGKYILDNQLHDKLRKHRAFLVCVVSKKPPATSIKHSKINRILNIGTKQKRLCMLKGLHNICLSRLNDISALYSPKKQRFRANPKKV